MTPTIKLLLIEDNQADVDLIIENLNGSKLLNHLSVVSDGIEAMRFLNRQEEYSDAPTPDLILLDLNIPLKAGFDVLAEIKSNEKLARIPVVILTSSQAEEDVLRSYELHANAYVTKPLDLMGFAEIVQGIENFWFSVVKFPPLE
ncbi:response regulator [Kiritimatiellaeota bacterium B1221]|nr:response regulator [Kiritimatiellaeota bacterium B1221]